MKKTFKATLAVLTLLLIFSVQIAAKENWIRVKSKNFILISNTSESDLRKVAIKLEQFRMSLSIIFPKTKLQTPTPTTVVLFKNNDAFHPFKPRFKGKIKEDVGGYFFSGPHMNYIVLAAGDDAASSYEIIFHEYEHYVIHNNLLRVPVWLDEGLAEFFSSFETSAEDQKVSLGVPLGRHVAYLREHSLVPLKTLLSVDHKSPYYNESSKAGTFYAESWALVHYLMVGNDGKRQSQLAEFIRLLSSDLSPEETFKQAFQMDLKSMDDELRPYLNRSMYPVLTITFKERLTFEKEMQSSALSEAEVQFYLGDLILHVGRPDEAESRLQKSLSLNPKLAQSQIALGILRLRQDKAAEARAFFQAAIESDPENYLAHYYYGGSLEAEGHHEEAIASYKKSIELNAGSAPAYSGLAYAYLVLGREDEAIEVLTRGLAVDPREEYFYQALAYMFLQKHKGQTAVNYAVGYLLIKGWREYSSQYMALVKYFGLRQSGRPIEAAKVLDEASIKLDTSAWPYPIIQYLKHSLSLQDLLTKSDTQDKLTETHAYAGLELSLSGDRTGALEHLRWVRENGNKRFNEFPLALAELARLEAQSGPTP